MLALEPGGLDVSERELRAVCRALEQQGQPVLLAGKSNRWTQGPGIGRALNRQALGRALSLVIKTTTPRVQPPRRGSTSQSPGHIAVGRTR